MNNSLNILIIEDDKNLGLTLNEYLIEKDHNCKLARNCSEAREKFNHDTQVVLMDIGLPDGDGISLAKEFRQLRKDFILLFLSAQNDPETKLSGLELGADDYITKPFDLRELMLRLKKAYLSHTTISQNNDIISIGSLRIHFKKYELIDGNGLIINLGQKECAILDLLYKKKGIVVSRDEILESIWGSETYPSNRTVDNYIVKLRKWLETDEQNAAEIRSIRSVGYQLIINNNNEG